MTVEEYESKKKQIFARFLKYEFCEKTVELVLGLDNA